MTKKVYTLHKDPNLLPVWKELLRYPAFFFREFKKDVTVHDGGFKESMQIFKDEVYRLFDATGDWVVKIYVMFVLIILPLLINFLLRPFFTE